MLTKHWIVVVMAIAIASSGLGTTPCWSGFNSCGDNPACQPGDPPEGATKSVCSHTFCDQDVGCHFSGPTKRVRTSTRDIWTWNNGGVVHNCVGLASIENEPWCCNCNQPGIYYNPP